MMASTSSDPSANGQESGTFQSERCEDCHRPLKDPVSMKNGRGPVCRKRHAAQVSARDQRDRKRED